MIKMKLSDFKYKLPEKLIAQFPAEKRDQSRLMVLDRDVQSITHSNFSRIGEYLDPGDILVLNETRVIPARLYGTKLPGGGKIELLLLGKRDDLIWEVLVGGKGLNAGRQLQVVGGPPAEVISVCRK